MVTSIVLVTAVLVLGLVSVPLWRALRAYRSVRGGLLVICPRTGRPAGLEVHAGHAAWTAALGRPEFRLRDCSRWPVRETAGCGEECLRQLEPAPEDSLVLTMLSHWHEKKRCVLCGTQIGATHWLETKPALLDPEGGTMRWVDVPRERLHEVLRTHRPICRPCHDACRLGGDPRFDTDIDAVSAVIGAAGEERR